VPAKSHGKDPLPAYVAAEATAVVTRVSFVDGSAPRCRWAVIPSIARIPCADSPWTERSDWMGPYKLKAPRGPEHTYQDICVIRWPERRIGAPRKRGIVPLGYRPGQEESDGNLGRACLPVKKETCGRRRGRELGRH
jgi:hypothetical protein